MNAFDIPTANDRTAGGGAPLAAAIAALRRGLLASHPGIVLSEAGYVSAIAENLLPHVERRQFEADLAAGDGDELRTKFRAAHSSSALAVNCFAPFKDAPHDLALAGQSGFTAVRFEAKCPTGIRGGRPPNLDVLAEAPDAVTGVESKCTEYFQRKSWTPAKPPFRPAYFEQIRDERRDGPWFRTMVEIDSRPDMFAHLDVAQLVKHAFGLARSFRGRQVTLLYLYWEPRGVEDHALFAQHRREIERFTDLVSGGTPQFQAMTYDDLWDGWTASRSPAWIADHIADLRRRYAVALRGDTDQLCQVHKDPA